MIKIDWGSSHTFSAVALSGHLKLPPNQTDNLIFHLKPSYFWGFVS